MAAHPSLENSSDADLLRRARRDSAAFASCMTDMPAGTHAFHRRRSRDPGAAMELTAETFAQAWLSRERYVDHAEGTAAPWLFGIARNVLAASVRKRAVERAAQERLTLGLSPALPRTVDETWLDGLDDDLNTALAELPDGSAAPSSSDLVDQAYEAVARELDCTPETARVRVHRGLRSIRQRLASSSNG